MQQRIDALYYALDKLQSIRDEVSSALGDMPLCDPDDNELVLWSQKKGVPELCNFWDIINNAADFANNAINSLEN